jgi:hypothetical protein
MSNVPLQAGWDFVLASPGTLEAMACRACGAAMDVTRNVVGPMGMAHAIAIAAGRMQGVPRDVFACPHSGEAWHRKALELLQEAERTPGRVAKEQLRAEAREVLQARESCP